MSALFLATSLLAAGSLSARQFKASVDLVLTDVLVTQEGKPVRGLTPRDFSVFVEGRRQEISHFQAIELPLGNRRVGGSNSASDVYANPAPSSRAFVFVVDNQHLAAGPESLHRVRATLTALLQGTTEDDDIAVVFTAGSNSSTGFTRDLPRHLQTIVAVKGVLMPSVGRSEREAAFHARSSLWTVRNAVRSLAGSGHSRRVVVLISEGAEIPLGRPTIPGRATMDEIRSTIAAAIEAGVVLFAVDPRGTADGFEFDRRLVQRAFLSALVLDTGGSVVGGINSVTAAPQQVLRDNGSFYVLGFHPERGTDAFQRLEIKARDPRWEIRSRTGFRIPSAASRAQASLTPARALDAALASSWPHTTIPIRATATPIGLDASGKVETWVTLAAGAEPEITEAWTVKAIALSPDGAVKASADHTLRPFAQSAEGTMLRFSIALKPGNYHLRVGLRRQHLGAISSVHMQIEVPDLHAEAVIAALILSDALEPPDSTISQLDRMITSTRRTFMRHQQPRATIIMFTHGFDGPPVTLRLSVMQDGREIVSTAASPISEAAGGGRRIVGSARLPLETLAPGPYEVAAVATYGKKRLIRRVPVVVANRETDRQ